MIYINATVLMCFVCVCVCGANTHTHSHMEWNGRDTGERTKTRRHFATTNAIDCEHE